MEQRERFVVLAQSNRNTQTELREQFGISRKTANKWLTRYAKHGREGLRDRSRWYGPRTGNVKPVCY